MLFLIFCIDGKDLIIRMSECPRNGGGGSKIDNVLQNNIICNVGAKSEGVHNILGYFSNAGPGSN